MFVMFLGHVSVWPQSCLGRVSVMFGCLGGVSVIFRFSIMLRWCLVHVWVVRRLCLGAYYMLLLPVLLSDVFSVVHLCWGCVSI